MPAATVLIPTHDHGPTLRYAIASVLAQSLQDFELFVVGDGVPDETRLIMDELCRRDKRIRFFDFPKGPRKGEVHRHAALCQASGRFVAYLGDDDLWLPRHLRTLERLLTRVDFGHTLHVGLDRRGKLTVYPADLANPGQRRRMLDEMYNRFDFTFGGHTLEAYRRLPQGWSTTPPECRWTDLYMWRKFLSQPWCRAATAMSPTGICTQSSRRAHLTNTERADELARWSARMGEPGFQKWFLSRIIGIVTRAAVKGELAAHERLEHAGGPGQPPGAG